MQVIPAPNWDALQVGELPRPQSKTPLLPTLPSPHPMHHDVTRSEDILHFGDSVPVYTCINVDRASLVVQFPPRIPSEDVGQELALDPLKQITDAIEAEESASNYKRRIRIDAIKAVFPDGKPKAMKVGVRNHKLDEAVKSVDKDIGLTDPREWSRLWILAHGKSAKSAH